MIIPEFVRCDACYLPGYPFDGESGEELRARLRTQEWSCDYKGDYCPVCISLGRNVE